MSNEQFGTLFDDADRVRRRFGEDIAPKMPRPCLPEREDQHAPNCPHRAR